METLADFKASIIADIGILLLISEFGLRQALLLCSWFAVGLVMGLLWDLFMNCSGLFCVILSHELKNRGISRWGQAEFLAGLDACRRIDEREILRDSAVCRKKELKAEKELK